MESFENENWDNRNIIGVKRKLVICDDHECETPAPPKEPGQRKIKAFVTKKEEKPLASHRTFYGERINSLGRKEVPFYDYKMLFTESQEFCFEEVRASLKRYQIPDMRNPIQKTGPRDIKEESVSEILGSPRSSEPFPLEQGEKNSERVRNFKKPEIVNLLSQEAINDSKSASIKRGFNQKESCLTPQKIVAQPNPSSFDPFENSHQRNLEMVIRDVEYSNCFISSQNLNLSLFKNRTNARDAELRLENCTLKVKKQVGSGAFASVWLVVRVPGSLSGRNRSSAEFSPKRQKEEECIYALKVLTEPSMWEFYIWNQLEDRLSEEQKINFPQVYGFYMFRNRSCLLMDYQELGSLQDVINLYLKSGKLMDEVVAIYYCIEILKIVESIHSIGIIHADLKPDNFLIRCDSASDQYSDTWTPAGWKDRGLILIDFGRSIDTRLYAKGTEFKGNCQIEGFQCVEMLTGRNWTFQLDLFGLCATVYCLLHGSYMDVFCDPRTSSWRPKQPFKRYHNPLWCEMFESFLNIQSCEKIPSISSFRSKFENYLQQNPQKSRKIRPELCRQVILMHESRSRS